MSRKIIGITVGTTLPKPDFEQADPSKGDYIKNKPQFATDDEIIEMLTELDMPIVVQDSNSTILADEMG